MKSYCYLFFCNKCGFCYSHISEEIESCFDCYADMSVIQLTDNEKTEKIFKTIFSLDKKEFLAYVKHKFKPEQIMPVTDGSEAQVELRARINKIRSRMKMK